MAHHRLFLPDATRLAQGHTLRVTGDEAHHALSVKRLALNDGLIILNGRGSLAHGSIAAIEGSKKHPELVVTISHVESVAPVSPRIAVWSAVPKNDRAAWMIEQLAQVGAAEWSPLDTARGVTEPSEHKAERWERIATEAAKQCLRAWTMTIGPPRTIADLSIWLRAAANRLAILADASGHSPAQLPRTDDILILVGPEGGWTDDERQTLTRDGAQTVTFGPHVMRIETATVAACARYVCP